MEPIAIVGIGCRFPQADSPESFWELLRNGKEAIAEIPKERWDIDAFYDPKPDTPGKMSTRWGGFLDQVDGFDADFFGISPEEAEHTDPQQRLFLEVAWEALERAGIVPAHLSGTQTGVFVGLCTIDYHRLLYKDYACIGPYSGIGTTPCITANRLSYLLDLRGPSISVDAACSSALVGVHLACQSLRSRESDLCLAGGVNLILSPDSTISSSQTRLLSAEGRCKTFDASADGYVRGEGCGVVVLKRLSDAVRDKDSILALIRGSAVNQDGLSNSLTAPNGLAQQALIRQALANGRVRPAEINYVEAHAVGTAIGDAIEFRALKTVLMEGRTADQICWIGSAKPNIGHLEAASGVAALIKVVLSLQHEEIPPLLHLEELNSYIDLANTPLAIPTECQPWTRGTASRLAGVSTFGFGGTNAHVVLEEAPLNSSIKSSSEPLVKRHHHLIALSAKTENALREVTQRYADYLAVHPGVALDDVCFTANARRTHFTYRLCLVTRSIAHLQQQLRATQSEAVGVLKGKVKGRKRPKLVFVFPGEEAEWGAVGDPMGCQLYNTQPIFRRAFDRCAEILQPFLEISLPIQATLSPPELFAIEYALAALWQSWGVYPSAVMGRGVGEYVAACITGMFDLEDALQLVLEYVRRQQVPLEENIRSGGWTDIANDVIYSKPTIPLLSNRTGNPLPHEDIVTSEYWHDRLHHPGHSRDDVLTKTENTLWLAIGPHSTIETETVGDCFSSLRSGEEDWQTILHSLGELYVRGIAIDWSAFERDYPRHLVALPTYPFQRQRYWFPTASHKATFYPEVAAQNFDESFDQSFERIHRAKSQNLSQLKKQGNFSDAQIQLLPELLKALAQQS